MKVRDSKSTISGDKTVYEMTSNSLDIIAEDGRSLFSIKQMENGVIEIYVGMVCKEGGAILDNKLTVIPMSTNLIYIKRPKYKD